MRVSKKDIVSPSADLMHSAAAHSGREHAVEGDRIVFRVCPFCDDDDGPKYAKNFRSSWYIGENGGGFRCVKCEKLAGPYLMFRALGVEIEGDEEPVSIRVPAAAASRPQARPVAEGSVEAQHTKSIVLLMLEPEGEVVRKYLSGRGLMPPDDYLTWPKERQTIGAWRYKDGRLGVAWWYFDAATMKPIGCKYRIAKARVVSKKERGMGRWPIDERERGPYRAHLLDPTCHEIVICEGEPDAETLARLNVKNVLSPPDGSDSVDCLFDYVERASSIYIVYDNDAAGFKMRRKILDWGVVGQFFYDVAFRKELGIGRYKDANEAYVARGEEYVLDCIGKATAPGVVNDVRVPRVIKTGFSSLDSQYFGLLLGAYSHICGKPGEGKTTFALSVMHSISRVIDATCSFVSLEQSVLDTNTSLVASMAGFDPSFIRSESVDVVVSALRAGVGASSAFKFFGKGADWHEYESVDYETMLSTIREACSCSGGALVVVDNYSVLRDALTTGKNALTEYAASSKVASDMLGLAIEGECHIMLINHIAGGGAAYGKTRLNPYADVSWRVTRVGGRTDLRCEKVRICRDGRAVTLRYTRGPNGFLVDAGYSSSRGGQRGGGDGGDGAGGAWNEENSGTPPSGPVDF